jgi:hypothetical protein
MIACGMAPAGSTSATTATSTLGPVGRLVQKLLAPLAYGSADVDLINHIETSPNITQSETFTTANPDNADQVVVAYNDSGGAHNNTFSGASVSTDGGLTFDRLTTNNGQSPFDNTMGDPVILSATSQPAPGSPFGWTAVVVHKASVATSLLPHGTRIAGAISAFIPTLRTTESLAGLTTIPLLPFTAGCTFPGMNSM